MKYPDPLKEQVRYGLRGTVLDSTVYKPQRSHDQSDVISIADSEDSDNVYTMPQSDTPAEVGSTKVKENMDEKKKKGKAQRKSKVQPKTKNTFTISYMLLEARFY